jgi:hypothetical protein
MIAMTVGAHKVRLMVEKGSVPAIENREIQPEEKPGECST